MKKNVLDLMFWNEAIYLIVAIFLLSPLDFEVFDIYTGPEGVLTTYNLTTVPVVKSIQQGCFLESHFCKSFIVKQASADSRSDNHNPEICVVEITITESQPK